MKMTLIASLAAIAIADLDKLEQVLRIGALIVPVLVGIVHAIRRPPRRQQKPQRSVKRVASTLPLLVLAALMVNGCKLIDVPRTVAALGRDTNAVSVSVRSPWGSVDVRRNAPAP